MLYDSITGKVYSIEKGILKTTVWEPNQCKPKFVVLPPGESGTFVVEVKTEDLFVFRELLLYEIEKRVPFDPFSLNVDFEIARERVLVCWGKKDIIARFVELFGNDVIFVTAGYVFNRLCRRLLREGAIKNDAFLAIDVIFNCAVAAYYRDGFCGDIFEFSLELEEGKLKEILFDLKKYVLKDKSDVLLVLPKYGVMRSVLRDYIQEFGETIFIEDLELFKDIEFNEDKIVSFFNFLIEEEIVEREEEISKD